MITVDIFGGLGNQMFQYALGRHLALKNSSELTLRFIDVGAFSKREYVLGCFKLAPLVRVNSNFKNQNSKFRLLLERILSFGGHEQLVKEKSFPFDSAVLKLRGENIHLFGYWQSWKYFEDIKETILEDFTFIRPLDERNGQVLEKIKKSNSISVHVRRGDYIVDPQTNKFHGVCGPDYYRKAFEVISKKVSSPAFYFFSDDSDWVKKNLSAPKGENFYIDWNTGRQSFVDMQLMSNCKHNILANSSFSWWGAWLSENKGKIVVAPKRWFVQPGNNTKDLLPRSWIKL